MPGIIDFMISLSLLVSQFVSLDLQNRHAHVVFSFRLCDDTRPLTGSCYTGRGELTQSAVIQVSRKNQIPIISVEFTWFMFTNSHAIILGLPLSLPVPCSVMHCAPIIMSWVSCMPLSLPVPCSVMHCAPIIMTWVSCMRNSLFPVVVVQTICVC